MIIIKTEEEIRLIRVSCVIAAKVLENLIGTIREGVTTIELDRLAEQLILAHKATPAFKGYRGYKHSTCLSVNDEVVHGIPSSRELKDGDIVGVDVGVLKDGYYGDVAATAPVGEIGKKARKLLKVGKECLDLGISCAKPGGQLGDIGAAIESHAKRSGFSVVRDLFGHGVGKNLHEDPLIPNFGKRGEGPELKVGMVIAIEPMLNEGEYEIETLKDGWTVVTKDRKLSSHFEHTILIGRDGPEILTKGQ